MADLETLDGFVGKYVSVTSPDGEYFFDGWCDEVGPVQDVNGEPARRLCVDYGYGLMVTRDARVEETSPPPGDPGPANGSR